MTSSMLTGERRWGPARRSGMTVIGKVAVPKPINLPSQRLENHGLDLNVEIVPKGTLSWGSRSSSCASNAWGSSTLSPKNDGGTSSPSHQSGRPSSGGSGTRPSTAGSDRVHEPIANAWGSNSRPSSASGTLSSNQTSLTSLRPRSAETRPGSSQLSRFAEHLSENSVAWGAAGTAEKLGVTSSKNDEFSLRSGDFPTLGAEKDSSGKNTESKDHGSQACPDSSSDGVAPVKERTGTSVAGDVSVNANLKSGTANSWRRDNPPYSEDGVKPGVEKWQADPQPYPNASMPPQHYDAWHGPPINNHPGGVWYGRPPGGPPYGSPVAPGGFPMEPYPYYRPQIPATALANPQPVPLPGSGPRGHHPKNGDIYRPHIPDAYIRPGLPMRPGFYPGPVAYEGYYAPPMGYCNSNERDIPFMGMAGAPPAYNRYPGQNAHDPGNSHAKSSGYGPTGRALASEQLESGHPHDTRGPYKVLLKQHNGWDEKNVEHKWEDTVTANASYLEKGDQPRTSSYENEWRSDYKKEGEMDLRRTALNEEATSQTLDNQGSFSVPVKVKSSESMGHVKGFDDISVKRSEHAAPAFPEVPAALKDSSLIQKIEGLNAKARASDVRHDATSVSSKEEQKNKLQVDTAKANHTANEVGTGSMHLERTPATAINNPPSHGVGVSTGDKSLESTAAGGTTISRRPTYGMHGRSDHRGKGRVNMHEVEGWQKKTPAADSSSVVSAARYENCNVHAQVHISVDDTEKSSSYHLGKEEGESTPSMVDSIDDQAQRAKMRELAKQRFKQREKEEEERTRDQKAKARVKLEELDRRKQEAEGLTQKLETVPSGVIQNKKEDFQILAEPTSVSSKSQAPSSAVVSDSNVVDQISERSTSRVEKPTVLSIELPLETPKGGVHKESVGAHNQFVPLRQDVNNSHNNAQQVHDSTTSRQKRMGHKQKWNNPLEKNSTEKFISTSTAEAPTSKIDLAVNVDASLEVVANEIVSCCESSLPVNTNAIAESLVHHRRKNNRGGKNRHKMEDASSMGAVPSSVLKEINPANTLAESGMPKASESESGRSSVQSDFKDANESSEQRSPLPNEETHGKVNNLWKSQHSRRMPRSTQANRAAEKFHSSDSVVWAPVRSQSKTEVTEEASQKTLGEAVAPSVKSDHQVQNNPRNKRAEMERYIPKPVAKEMAQQGGSQQPVALPINQTTSDATIGRADSGSQGTESSQLIGSSIGKVGFAMESRNGDSRQNKQGKVHGSWRQRGSTESTIVQDLQDLQDGQLFSSNPTRNVQKSIEHLQPQKPDVNSLKEQPKYSDEWNASDGWNIPESSDSTSPVVPVVKDQGGTARGKRHLFKGHKSMGGSHGLDHKRFNSGDTDKIYTQASVPETSQIDLPSASKESRGVGERSTSQWQPKSHAFSATNQRESRPNGGTGVGRANKKDFTPQGVVPLPPQQDKEASRGMASPHHDQSISEKTNVEEALKVVPQEAKRDRKTASLRGRPHSPNQGPGSPVEPAHPPNMDVRREQRLSSGFRKNGSQNSRFGRGHESRGEWSSSGPDNKQHNPHNPLANRERQRHNTHYEYQPIGPHNNIKANNFEGPKDDSYSAGARPRERGQSHSRRGGGNFYGRQGGTVQADGGYD